jgi:hypothetical protein
MNTDDLETVNLNFINQPQLNDCVAAGKMYQVDDDIFILFVLAEDDGCTICYARGNQNNTPIGDSFTRLIWFDNLEKSLEAFEKFDTATIEHFKTVQVELPEM